MAALQQSDDAADRVVGLGVDAEPPAEATAPAVEAARPRRRRQGIAFWMAVGWLIVVAFCGIFAEWLPLPDRSVPDVSARFGPPNPDNPLGADALGRD